MKDQPEFPTLALLASRGLLAPDAWKCKRAQVSLKATIDVPMLGPIIEQNGDGLLEDSLFFVDGANWLSPGHHTLRLTCGPAGNRTATGSLSATSRTSPYQLLHRDALGFWKIPTCQWDGHYTSMVPSGNVVFIELPHSRNSTTCLKNTT